VEKRQRHGNPDCRRVNGTPCPLTANAVRQLIGSGTINGAAPADQGTGQADDVNFAQQPEPGCNPVPTPTCTDPNHNTTFDTTEQNGGAVVSPLAESHRYPARKGFDEFYGYGRINAYKAVSAVAAGRVPPEAEITAPDWFERLDPGASKIDIAGRVDARPPAASSTPNTGFAIAAQTAAARKAAATARPIHRPGLLRKLPGAICVIGLVGNISGDVETTVGTSPINRDPTKAAKCRVWKAICSTPPIAMTGNAAHRNVARRAHPDTSSSQQ